MLSPLVAVVVLVIRGEDSDKLAQSNGPTTGDRLGPQFAYWSQTSTMTPKRDGGDTEREEGSGGDDVMRTS